jgi:hypothetical protein
VGGKTPGAVPEPAKLLAPEAMPAPGAANRSRYPRILPKATAAKQTAIHLMK